MACEVANPTVVDYDFECFRVWTFVLWSFSFHHLYYASAHWPCSATVRKWAFPFLVWPLFKWQNYTCSILLCSTPAGETLSRFIWQLHTGSTCDHVEWHCVCRRAIFAVSNQIIGKFVADDTQMKCRVLNDIILWTTLKHYPFYLRKANNVVRVFRLKTLCKTEHDQWTGVVWYDNSNSNTHETFTSQYVYNSIANSIM